MDLATRKAKASARQTGFAKAPTPITDNKRKLSEMNEETDTNFAEIIDSVINDSFVDEVSWLDSSDIGLDEKSRIHAAKPLYESLHPGFNPEVMATVAGALDVSTGVVDTTQIKTLNANHHTAWYVESKNTSEAMVSMAGTVVKMAFVDASMTSAHLEREVASKAKVWDPAVKVKFYLIRAYILCLNLFQTGTNKDVKWLTDADQEITGDFQTFSKVAKTCLTTAFIKGVQFLFFLRSLNHYRSRHTTLGDLLPLPQVVAISAVLGIQGTKTELADNMIKRYITWLFYTAVHACDPATYLTMALPKLGVNLSYNQRVVMSEPRLGNYEKIRSAAFPAGTAIVVLAYQFVLRLLETGHVIMVGQPDLIMEALSTFNIVKKSGASAHVDAAYYGRVPASIDTQKVAELLPFLKSYSEVLGGCKTLAASPRIRSSDMNRAPQDFEDRLTALKTTMASEELSAAIQLITE